jgi:hypothetical protein
LWEKTSCTAPCCQVSQTKWWAQLAEEPESTSMWMENLLHLDTQLGEQMATGDTQNCDEARNLRDRICELAERICKLADRNPDQPTIRDQCADGRMRCERAKRVVADRCG